METSPLANFERARWLMKHRGLDALVALERVNVRYFAGYQPFLSHMGFEWPGLVVVPRDPKRPVTLVASAVDVWRLSQQPGWHPENIIPFTAAVDHQALESAAMPEAFPPTMGWSTHGGSLTANDRDMLAYLDKFAPNSVPSPQWGLVKALKDLGLETASIAYDRADVLQAAQSHGLEDVRWQNGGHLMRRIRMVKTPGEIDLMRAASQANAAAADAAMSALEVGMRAADIERLFAAQCAKRGNAPVFIVAGSLHGLPHGEIVEGAPILVDAVSEQNGYHGDYGRTFMLGAPPAGFKPKARKLQVGWQAAFDMIRPGVRYSDIREAAQNAVRKEALGEQLAIVNPHSVGMQHTDEPGDERYAGFVKDDITLEAGMTLTVDLPHVEPGWGACHLEDLIVVTETGAEPLHDMSNPVVSL
ncbi:MAG: Xaa-Pro peptidase family protein [Pseudomonadota bacterium]